MDTMNTSEAEDFMLFFIKCGHELWRDFFPVWLYEEGRTSSYNSSQFLNILLLGQDM